jgi:outer membrane protein OmpA-like peptidoglycan-associated protein
VKEPVKEPVKKPGGKGPVRSSTVKNPVKAPAVVAAPVVAPPVTETPIEEKPAEKPAEQIETVAVAQPQTRQDVEMSEMDHAIQNKMENMEFYYDYNSAILTTKSRNLLDRVAVVLNQYPDWKLMVRSYTDSRGSDAYNKDLSALRCYAVIDYLVKKGVASSKLYYENIGKDPADPCGKGVPCTDEQYMRARRTMLKIIHK